MADTPRVTVPVEPVPNMPAVDWSDDSLVKIASGEVVTWGEAKRRLSAAPAPEGGAVPKSILAVVDHFEMARAQDLAFSISRYCNGPLNVSVGDLRALVALATREEAPAEVGEIAQILTGYRNLGPHSDRDAAIAHLCDLLERAQPPAREDAQPVSVCDGVEQPAFEEWAAKQGFDMHEHPLHYLFLDAKTDAARQAWKAGLEHAVGRMSTHPAPDALRVAVEALERGISRCESYERINLHGTTQSARKAGTLRNVLFDMRQALAALQAEGGAS